VRNSCEFLERIACNPAPTLEDAGLQTPKTDRVVQVLNDLTANSEGWRGVQTQVQVGRQRDVMLAQLAAEKGELRAQCASLRAALEDAVEQAVDFSAQATHFQKRILVGAPFHRWHALLRASRDGARDDAEHMLLERRRRGAVLALLGWRGLAHAARIERIWGASCGRFLLGKRVRAMQVRLVLFPT
jgi:hypothetical protein